MRRRRWQIILPVAGLLLFELLNCATYIKEKRELKSSPQRYVWWWGIQLDREPLKIKDESGWDQNIYVELGPLQKLSVATGLPAFYASAVAAHSFDRFGWSELTVFLISNSLGLAVWYWFVGWLIDRWRWHRAESRSR